MTRESARERLGSVLFAPSLRPVVIVLAAGRGLRMRSPLPKALHSICGRPMIDWPVRAALGAGAHRVVVVDGPGRRLAAHLPAEVELAVQPEPRGTADAIRWAVEHVDPNRQIVVLPADRPLITSAMVSALVAVNTGSRAAATMLTTMVDEPAGPARVERDVYGDVARVGAGVVARELDTGIACFDGRALLRGLARLGSDDLRDLFELLAGGRRVRAHVATDPTSCLGVDDQIDLARVRPFAQRRVIARHLEHGVTVVDPDRTVVDVDVEIGAGTVLEPGCQLEGATVIGRDCHVGPHTTLRDARLGDGVSAEHSVLVGCDLADQERVGPFTYLRPDAAPARLRARAPQLA